MNQNPIKKVKIRNPREWKLANKIIVIAVVTLIGVKLIFSSFAATNTIVFNGILDRSYPTPTYTVKVKYSGSMTEKLAYADGLRNMSLYVYNSSGSLVSSGSGKSPINLSTSVSPGTYTLRLRGNAISKKDNFVLSVTPPISPPADTTPPTNPTGLVATPASTSQINLSWANSKDNVGVTGYDILRNNVLVATSPSNTYSDGNLTPGTSYSYQVKAYDASGNVSGASNTATASTNSNTKPPTSGYISASGTNFMNNGSIFKFIGFDAYGMEGCYNGTPWTTAQLDSYFSSLPSNGVTRIWAFRTYGTAVIGNILTEAAKYKQHVILTLGDDNSTCGETDGSVSGDHSGKTLAFYQTGWQGQYLAWVNTIVPLFKNNTSIMMWEVANEPGNKGAVPSEAIMQAYLKGASDAIRANDPNHLISVGASIPASFGGLTNYVQALDVPNIDAISFHDYSYEYEKGAEVSGTLSAAKQASTTDNKPFYAGEAGVPSGPSCSNINYTSLTLPSRVNFLNTKATDYFNSGIGGIDFWEAEPSQASWVGSCAYEMYPNDPMISTVKGYIVP